MDTIDTFDHEYNFLSNFYPCEITVDTITYPSVEHAFQAMKTTDDKIRLNISKNRTPGHAKHAGRSLLLRPDWEEIKLQVMYDLVKQKFNNPALKKKLLDTYPKVLIEGNTWHDNFWGCCECDKCINKQPQNNLGKILIRIRKELLDE